ncbi:hypothetical protein JYT16_01500 [Gemmatimonas aurantiaca]|nr:hypothetical protein [Gemmatimonas aurantiaca]
MSAPNTTQRNSSVTHRHLLLIQPIAHSTDNIDEQVRLVCDITGQHQYTVRQKLVGSAFDILRIDSDLQALQEQCRNLREAGFYSALLDHETLHTSARQVYVNALEKSGSGGLNFLNLRGDTVGWVNAELTCHITVGSLRPEMYGENKALLSEILGSGGDNDSASKKINDISREKPALILQISGSPTMFVFELGRFNFNSLPGKAELSAALNFQRLITLLLAETQAEVNTDFGLKTFPYGILSSLPENVAATRKRLLLYAQIAFLGHNYGLANSAGSKALASQSFATRLKNSTTKPTETQLAPPPNAPKQYTEIANPESVVFSGGYNRYEKYIGKIKSYGPPSVVTPLGLMAILLMGMKSSGEFAFSVGWAILPLGALGCLWSLTMTLRKRAIEHLPTSRIRSMPTGTVEICGETQRKYHLQAPYSLTRCVYFSYKILTLQHYGVNERGQPRERWRVTERGDSGPVPFYLQDETGKVLIDPKGAIVSAGQTEEYAGDMYAILAGSGSNGQRRIIETVIPEGAKLYIIGHARPQKNSASEKRREYLQRLRAIRSNPESSQVYDTNADGELSYQEWEVARSEVEQNMLDESLQADNSIDTVVVGDDPSSGLFYISDKTEPEILGSYGWKIPLSAVIGFIILASAVSRIIG